MDQTGESLPSQGSEWTPHKKPVDAGGKTSVHSIEAEQSAEQSPQLRVELQLKAFYSLLVEYDNGIQI